MDFFETIASKINNIKDCRNFTNLYPQIINPFFQQKSFQLKKPINRDVVLTRRPRRQGDEPGEIIPHRITSISINFLDTKVYERIINFVDNLDEKGPLEKNLRNGHWVGNDLQGRKIYEGHYKNGFKNGFWRDWAMPDLRVIQEGFYLEGEKNGYWKIFAEEVEFGGNVTAEGNFVNGEKQGYWRYYSPDGDELRSYGNFSKDQKVGYWTYINPFRVKYEGKIDSTMPTDYFF